jgi:hypothetical protein
MARRQPTRPAWENPPRMDNFPRLRSRDDRNNNQPLILAAVGVAVLMVALIVVPLISGGGGGSSPSKSTGSPGASQSLIAGGPSDGATPTPMETPTAGPTLQFYTVGKNKWDATLTSIAAHFKIPLALLEAANPLDPNAEHHYQAVKYDIVFPGMTMYIPWPEWVPPTPVPTPTPTPTPTLKPTPTPKPTPTSTF